MGNSKRIGNNWESQFELLCRSEGIYVVPIPDGARWIAKGRPIAVRAPFDFMIFRHAKAAAIDTKTTAQKTFSHSYVDENQLKWLLEVEMSGVPAGYLVHFRKTDQIIFFPASVLFKLTPKDSLSPEEGIYCGSLGRSKIEVVFSHI